MAKSCITEDYCQHFFSFTENKPDDLGRTLRNFLYEHSYHRRPLVFLCIGTDRATGDCLGPIVGYKLTLDTAARCKSLGRHRYHVYGTLDDPVHARNLSETIESINKQHRNPLIVAIDASLGKNAHVGCATLWNGPMKPGAGVDKELPSVGELSITGIVNIAGVLDQMLLQTTRLNTVMHLAEYIYSGIKTAILSE